MYNWRNRFGRNYDMQSVCKSGCGGSRYRWRQWVDVISEVVGSCGGLNSIFVRAWYSVDRLSKERGERRVQCACRQLTAGMSRARVSVGEGVLKCETRR